jgi:hypothetical protein
MTISYRPTVGMSDIYNGFLIKNPASRKEFCITPQVRAELTKRKEGYGAGSMITEYILRTAHNWSGPIGHFHLTLKTGAAESVLAVCWDDGLKKTGPTTYEFTRDNYLPARDIHMLELE